MKRTTLALTGLLLVAGVAIAAPVVIIRVVPRTTPVTPPRPRLEPVAETKLLMEGLAQPNYKAMEKLLKEKPADMEAWKFARGQSLLLAETGNLLMLRPPRNNGEAAWMARATELREAATMLARHAASQDLDKTRAAVKNLANTCNRCHEQFRVKVRVGPEAPGGETRDAE